MVETFDYARENLILRATRALELVARPDNADTDFKEERLMLRSAAMIGCFWHYYGSNRENRYALVDAESELVVGTVEKRLRLSEGSIDWSRARWRFRRRWGKSGRLWLGRVCLIRAVVEHIQRTGKVL